MNGYTLSEAADGDIQHIFIGSLGQWGVHRAERYVIERHALFEKRAAFPHMGRNAGHIYGMATSSFNTPATVSFIR